MYIYVLYRRELQVPDTIYALYRKELYYVLYRRELYWILYSALYQKELYYVLHRKEMYRLLSYIKTDTVQEGTLPDSFDGIEVGSVLPGCVQSIKPFGIFVKLPVWNYKKTILGHYLIPTRYCSRFYHISSQFSCICRLIFS